MLTKEKKQIKHIPTALVYKGHLQEASQKGCIFFFHGLRASKDVQSKELESLAEHGFLVVGVDNVGHGERLYPDFETRFAPDNPSQFETEFVEAVWGTAQDVTILIDELTQAELIHPGKIGAAGISMGGFIIYSAITLEPRINVAATIVAAPPPQHQLDKFSAVYLLSQNAGLDENVPNHHTRDFHQQLQNYYPDYDNRFAYVEYPDSPHFMREEDWHTCWGQLIGWFETHL